MNREERADIREAVRYHRLHGGYDQHNAGGRMCRCAACRLVRTVVDLDEAQEAVLALWREMPAPEVRIIRDEFPEVVELCRELHEQMDHEFEQRLTDRIEEDKPILDRLRDE